MFVESCGFEVRGVQDPSRNLGTDPGSDSGAVEEESEGELQTHRRRLNF